VPAPDDVLTRPAPGPDLVLRYGPGPDHVVDVRLPASAGPAPLVVVLHGGFWRAEHDRAHAGPQCSALAEAGYVVAAVEYRRTGRGGGWPATFDDVAAAVDAVPGLVAGAAPGRLRPGGAVLVGHSAGGHLALWAASRDRLPPGSRWHRPPGPSTPRAVVGLGAVCDLRCCGDLDLDGGAASALLGGGPDDVPDRYAQADPLTLAPPGVPAVLVHGTDDDRVPVEMSRRYAAAGGDSVRLVELPGTGHFEVIDPRSRVWPAVLDAIRMVVGA
jgi:acetyl esterase/lipase